MRFPMNLPLPMFAPVDGEGASVEPPAGNEGIASGGLGELPGGNAGGNEDEINLDGLEIEAEGVAEPEEIEWEDIDHDDLKIRVPKGLSQKAQEALMRTADYTKKTQEVAAKAKDIETREKAIAIKTDYDDKLSEGKFHVQQMDKALKAEYDYFQSPAWTQAQQDDPFASQQRWNQFQVNERTFQRLVGGLNQLAAERNSKLAEIDEANKAEVSKRREQLPREIAKLIPGWNSDMEGKVKEFAVGLGYEPEALASSTEAKHWQTLHLAMIGQKYLQAVARKGSGAVTPKSAPVTKTVGTRGGAERPNPATESPDAYRVRILKEKQAAMGMGRK
jgi:hypothetical protein